MPSDYLSPEEIERLRQQARQERLLWLIVSLLALALLPA